MNTETMPSIIEVNVSQLSAENFLQLGQAGYDFYVQSLQNPQVLLLRRRTPAPAQAQSPVRE